MYTILLTEEKSLIATEKEAIMQASNLVDKLRFLVPFTIGDNDMSTFTKITLEYITPVSREYRVDILQKAEEFYESEAGNYFQYILPVNTKLTAEAGDIELQLTFYNMLMTADGEVESPVFKTQPCIVKIIPVANWSQYVASADFTQLDQRILEIMAIQEQINDTQEQIITNGSGAIIDDENISEYTTYSSKKIEEKFFDEEEVSVEVNETIDETLTEQTITDNEILDLFDDTGNTEDTPSETPDGGNQDEETEEVPENSITEEDIDNLFK